MNKILRKIRNFIGNFEGYSGCGICGDTWNWKKEHQIEGDGAFPTCEECWQTRSDDEILEASDKLAMLWLKDEPYYSGISETQKRAKHLIKATKEALKNRNK